MPGRRAHLAALAEPLAAGTALPPPQGVFPRYVESDHKTLFSKELWRFGSDPSKIRCNGMMLIDSHCHLDYFTADELPAILARAAEAGVGEMVTIGTRLTQAPESRALAEANDAVWCTVGMHPHHAAEAPVPQPEAIAALTAHPKVIGIGESGLDYFYDSAPRDVQQDSFRAHIRAARRPACRWRSTPATPTTTSRDPAGRTRSGR